MVINIFLIIVFLYALLCCFIAGKKISQKQASSRQKPFIMGLVLGGFVWVDIWIFSFYWMVAAVSTIFLHHFVYFALFFFSFWFIRSCGETLYWFLQQFHPDFIPWQEYFLQKGILSSLTNTEWRICMQIIWQVIAALCLVAFIYCMHVLFT